MRRGALIVAYKSGALANRLVNSAHILAFALENGLIVYNLALDEYADEFVGPARHPLARFPPPRSASLAPRARHQLYWLANRAAAISSRLAGTGVFAPAIRLDWDESLDLTDPPVSALAKRRRAVFMQGWDFRAGALLSKYASPIRSYYSPLPSHVKRVTAATEAARQSSDILVGLHMRRGDYRAFRAGKWFYSVSQYREVLSELTSLFPRTSLGLLITTDDSRALSMMMNDHGPLKVASICSGPGDAIGDLYSLARCDFIIGPPSTYSMWASFYGQTPRYTLWAPEAPKSLEQFEVNQELVFTGKTGGGSEA